MIQIIIGGDIVPTQSNFKQFENGNKEMLIGERLSIILEKSNYIILNLEVPLTNEKHPIQKAGPCLSAPLNTIRGLKKINPYFYTLANNHIMDQGERGLKATIDILRKNNIQFAGVGNNLEEAMEMPIVTIEDVKLGIYCCVEHEFSIATDNSSGANPYDPLESFDAVKKLKEHSDMVIVLYHGGKEHYRYPSPNIQKIFRKFATSGADYVVAQHSHCIGCFEIYKNSILVYGQGNFLFDRIQDECWNTSLLLKINYNKIKKSHAYQFIPIVRNNNAVEYATEKLNQNIMKEFYMRSNQILNSTFVNEEFERHANRLKRDYMYRFSGGFGRLLGIRILNKITKYKFLDKMYSGKVMLAIENNLECESHRELASTIAKCERRKMNLRG